MDEELFVTRAGRKVLVHDVDVAHVHLLGLYWGSFERVGDGLPDVGLFVADSVVECTEGFE